MADFNTVVVHVLLGSIVKRPREGKRGINILGRNLFVPTILINVGHKGGGQIWTIRREGVTSRQVPLLQMTLASPQLVAVLCAC